MTTSYREVVDTCVCVCVYIYLENLKRMNKSIVFHYHKRHKANFAQIHVRLEDIDILYEEHWESEVHYDANKIPHSD
jgi:hypothetical protein